MLKIYVTNLSKYNEGVLVGEWVSLPCEGLEEVLNKISNNGKTCRMMKLSHFKHTWSNITT